MFATEPYFTLSDDTETQNLTYAYDTETGFINATYKYETYNCADISMTAKNGYIVQAVEADLVYGQNGSDGITATKLDNVQGGSTVEIYLAPAYTVEYYVGGNDTESDEYTDDKVYSVDKTGLTAGGTVPNEDNTSDEDKNHDAQGMQKEYPVTWKAAINDTITLVDATGLNAWYPKWDAANNTVDGDKLNASLELAAILADTEGAIYTVNGNVIKFFGETENPDVTVTKSLTAITRNGKEVTPDDDTELKVGDEITYEIKVKNTGNVNLSGLTVTDTFNGNGTLPDVKDAKGNVVGQWNETSGVWTYEIANLPVNGEETFTYTYTVVQLDAAETNGLTNTAAVSGDNTDPDDDKAEDERPVKDDGDITLRPADITIYMGGYGGYEAVVGDDGQTQESTTLPEPGFYITLPETVQKALSDAGHSGGTAADLSNMITVTATTNDGKDRSWTLQKYSTEEESTTLVTGEGGSAQEHFLYRIVPEADQPAIRVVFTNPETGEQITSDVFDPTTALYDSYDMALYTGDVNVKAISLQITVDGKTFYCGYDDQNSKSGKLTVRYTSSDATTTRAVSNLDAEVAEAPNAFYAQFADAEQKFYINEQDTLPGNVKTGVEVDQNNVYLLADNVIGIEGLTEMQERARQAAGFEKTGAFAKYFDLVDIQNGNAWLTPQDGTEVKVYWPYPAGTDQNTEFNLYHFVDLDREMLVAEAENEVANSKMVPVTIEKTETGITFKTSSFSPFVLVQDTTRPSGGGDEPSGGDDGNNNSNNNNTNNSNTTKTNVVNNVSAPAAPATTMTAIPQTGDESQPLVWVTLVVLSGAALAGLAVYRKKRSDK